MQPTKQDILDYLDSNTREHTPYLASLHFDIKIEEVYKILKGE